MRCIWETRNLTKKTQLSNVLFSTKSYLHIRRMEFKFGSRVPCDCHGQSWHCVAWRPDALCPCYDSNLMPVKKNTAAFHTFSSRTGVHRDFRASQQTSNALESRRHTDLTWCHHNSVVPRELCLEPIPIKILIAEDNNRRAIAELP